VSRRRPAVLVLAATMAAAPAASATEWSAGYSGLRARGDFVHGAVLGATWPRAQGALRLSLEASGESGLSAGENLRELGLLGGAALAPWSGARWSPFVSLKAGIVRARRQVEVFGVAIGPDRVCDAGCPYSTGPAAEIGGGLDLRLGGRWALRLAQADYRIRRLAGQTERGVRLSAGIVRR
jgi:hypothetical protein